MDQLHILTLFGFLAAVNGAQNASSSSYLILVSRVVRPGIPTTVSVTNLRDSPVLVVSELIHGNSSIQTQSSIKAGSTETQVLPAISETDMSYWFPYELSVRGYVKGTLVFSNSTMLHYSPKSMLILLQTDKPNYKPGQAVKIRAVLLTPDGKPYDEQIDIVIMDPRQNRVHQWLSVDTVLGTASREFQLSENPPLGKWEMMASVNEVTQKQVFNVHHYVLPKFEVEVEAPEVLYYKDHLTYTVTAQYLYGKPVMGMLTITYVHGFHGVEAHYGDQKMIDGTADLSFDVPALYRRKRFDDYLYPYYGGSETSDYIDINVQVTERLTGVTHNSTVRISIAMCRYNLEFQHYPPTIKPSLSFSFQLKLSTYNNHPLTSEDQDRRVSVTISQQTFSPMVWDDPANLQPRSHNFTNSTQDIFPASTFPYPSGNMPVERLQLYVPADGVLPISTQLTEDVATLTIEVQYEDTHKTLQLYREYSSPSKSYIQLQTTSNFQIGQPLTITVETNFPFAKFHYMVTARGQVLDAGTLNSSSFTLSPDLSWFPSASVVVYCIRPDGEIINDALDVSFTQVLRNNVSLSFGTHRAEPAEAAFLTVSVSEPGSLVGILVVDKGSLDSERTNDITERKVIEELSKFSTEVSQPLLDWMSMRDPYSVFMASGMTVLTDARLNPVYTYLPVFRPELREGVQMLALEEEEQQQRRNFPETWLWLDINMNQSTTTFLPLTVPDSMTSWVATAFVISENLGLGISAPVELKVFKDFFLSLNLPAYIIRGELLLLEVSLFNYMDRDLEVFVMVQESSMFEFVSPSGEDSSMDGMMRVSIWSQNGTTVLFPIKVMELGQVPIIVKATSLYASDSVYQTILVKPEGIEQSFTQTLFLEFPLNKMILSRELEFNFPVNVVPGSQRAMVTAVGDLLGPSISGLDALIQMPYGCGEQNMINFAPNVYILQYLSSTGRIDEEIRSKAVTYMTQGYERELSYQRIDGSFSAFGDSDSSGSTWLSAFVLRCFLQARAFIYIDEAVLMRTAYWLSAQQGPDGAFQEPGRVIHTELQGGLDSSVSLTAYVLMALLEDVEYNRTFSGQVSAAINYLTLKLSRGISSNYSLCLVTYALSLAQSPHATTALNELMNRAQIHNDVPTWSSPDSSLLDSWQPRSADIEMAAYTLLSIYKQGSVEHGFSLMKWLSQQRNHLGGYSSTQDTVIALQALSAYATLSSVEQIDLTITVTDPRDEVATFTINRSNYLLYQSQEIEAKEELHIRVSAMGKGFAVFQLTTFYNIEAKGLSRRRRDAHTPEAFDLDIHVMDYDLYNIYIFICFRLSEDQELNQTGMAILDVGLLTGFSLAQNGILINSLVRRVETSPGKVILYLDSVTKIEECIEVPTTMEFKVTSVQDAAVAIYDYYEPRRKTVKTYTSEARRDLPVCHICGKDCSQCENNEVSVYDSILSSHQSNYLVQCLAFVLLITLALCF
ncbi:CD109 antigen isoform X2 [Colossoma macropomum]|uniref:CD109 antigen isoform X2 n=1 Tax=Colossoma macropomum TaxID=42526 RepID=UPI0018654018|nr:CD109 antigen isoform X2 [Colossoma macropomum]